MRDDVNQSMMMGAGAAVTMASCANNAVDSSLDLTTHICNESSSGFGALFGMLIFVVPAVAVWFAWDMGLHIEYAMFLFLPVTIAWICLWAKFFSRESQEAAVPHSASFSEDDEDYE
jgi:hypothetical protein